MTISRGPRILPTELWTEARLTNRRVLVVEGPSDARFFKAWLTTKSKAIREQPLVVVTDEIDIPMEILVGLGLNDGARSRVIAAAVSASASNANARCVADLDCGEGDSDLDSPHLVWTDYPALESYVLRSEVLDHANMMHFEERLPPGSLVVEAIAPCLALLYAVRANYPDSEHPTPSKGFGTTGVAGSFAIERTVHISRRADVSGITPTSYERPQEVAYGHDIAELMFALWANVLRNRVQVASPESLERILLNSMLAEGSFEDELLFRTILEWAFPTI